MATAFTLNSSALLSCALVLASLLLPTSSWLTTTAGSCFGRGNGRSSTSFHRDLHSSVVGWSPHTCIRYKYGGRPFSLAQLHSSEETNDDDDNDDVLDEDTIHSLLKEMTDEEEDPYALDLSTLTPGLGDGCYIVKRYAAPSEFNLSSPILDRVDLDRLGLRSNNVTLPIALMMLDPMEYPTLSRARKACRKGTILIERGQSEQQDAGDYLGTTLTRGRVADRITPTDISICKQERLSHGAYSTFLGHSGPPFELPIVYEDEHFAIVNKPAGVLVYDDAKGGYNGRGNSRNTIRYALPYVLTPPPQRTPGEEAVVLLRRPVACHRLDKPTSGLLVVAKTRDAAVDLSRQFEQRIVKKTYTAIVNGVPLEDPESSISSRTAYELGVDVNPDDDDSNNGNGIRWQLVHGVQEGKEALTVWRTLRCCKSLKAKDGCVTMVELKPKTGRKHQLRRVMAWVCDCPLVGDTTYGLLYDAKKYGRGLMLCSNKLKLLHPYYNTPEGREEWEQLGDKDRYGIYGGMLHLSDDDGMIWVIASIDLPNKFETFLATEEKRASYS